MEIIYNIIAGEKKLKTKIGYLFRHFLLDMLKAEIMTILSRRQMK